MSSICDRIADDEKEEEERRAKVQEACQHEHKQATRHFTYGMHWRCADCGKRGETWWD